MDISMPPGQSGLVACEKIAKDFPGTKVVILTMFAEPEYLFYTLRGGAAGYVLKNSTSEELIAAVHAVAEGGSYIHPKMTAMLTKQLVAGGEEEDRSYQQLSNRELEILQLLAKGFTNKEISEQIFLSVKTVEAHRSKIYQKLGLKTRADLVDYCLLYTSRYPLRWPIPRSSPPTCWPTCWPRRALRSTTSPRPRSTPT